MPPSHWLPSSLPVGVADRCHTWCTALQIALSLEMSEPHNLKATEGQAALSETGPQALLLHYRGSGNLSMEVMQCPKCV